MRLVFILISLIVAIESTNRKDVCRLPKEVGPCKALKIRWYYNKGSCEEFKYGGCKGNGNNFKSLMDCQKLCLGRRRICRLPKLPGPCKGYIPRWYYDIKAGKCQEFIYGGCLGNGNNFLSREQCKKKCERLPPGCKQCKPGFERVIIKDKKGCAKCYCKPTCDLIKCPKGKVCKLQPVQCVTTPCFDEPECVGNCKDGKVWKKCASSCPPTCDKPRPVCDASCAPAQCQCPPGRPIWSKIKGKCTTLTKCTCKGGMVMNICMSHCVPTCENPYPPCTDICSPAKCTCPREKPIWSVWQYKCIACPKCHGGMVWKECASFCPPTCSNTKPECDTKKCAPPQCQCPAIKPIWSEEEKKCIAAEECPKCKGGMIWRECASHCEPTCENLMRYCILSCAPAKCQCPSGTPIWSNSQQKCVNMCPKCKGGMVWRECASLYPPSCSNPKPDCSSELCAPAQCQCPKVKPIWSEKEQKCITADMCPQCQGGMVWRDCASHCKPTCKDPFPTCALSCAPAQCQCPPEKPIWSGWQKLCISVDMCPKCPMPMVWSDRGAGIQLTCYNRELLARILVMTKPGCVCPSHLPAVHGNTCIAEKDCPPKPPGSPDLPTAGPPPFA